MDYADATLVIIADMIRSSTVFTLDKRGFQTYRRGTGEAFTLLP
jgi:predicted nucleic acid-binding protein